MDSKVLKEMKAMYVRASNAYYNTGKSLMSDAAFDKLEAEIRKADPTWSKLKKTGVAVIDKKTEVALDRFMPSLNKRYPQKIESFAAKLRTWTVMDKLDGAALQLTYENFKPVKLATRGDGVKGGDISFLIPHVNVPKRIDVPGTVVIRCEGVMKKKIFTRLFAANFENARSMVNGWFNRRKPDPNLAKVSIVVLGVYGRTITDGIKFAQRNKFDVVHAVDMNATNWEASLSHHLSDRRAKSEYEMDGLVLAPPDHEFGYASSDKPKWTVAFKENVDVANATKAVVEKIIYQDSRNSNLIPKIKIRPVRMGGVTVNHATCHNAQWMLDRGIGPGAIIKIVRSGDVIPKIVGVVKKAKPQLPTVPYVMKGVHFRALNRSREADINALNKFFGTMGIEFIAKKTIGMLYDDGFTDALKYLKAWSGKDLVALLRASGLGNVMSAKVVKEFDRVFTDGVLLRDLMVASNVFDVGLGDRKLQAIEKHFRKCPTILVVLVKGNSEIIRAHLAGVPSYAEKTTDLVVNGMPAFRKWLKEALKYIKVRQPEAAVEVKKKKGLLTGVCVTFTGYRDKSQEKFVTDNGGEVVSFGSRTKVLLYKEGGKASTKVDKARASGKINVITFEEWKL